MVFSFSTEKKNRRARTTILLSCNDITEYILLQFTEKAADSIVVFQALLSICTKRQFPFY